MRYKIAEDGDERARPTGGLFTRAWRNGLRALAMIVWLATPALTDHTYPLTGSADMHITQVRRLSDPADGPAVEIEIRWTALLPRFTTVNGFEATLEVRYSDGAKEAVSSHLLKASDRTVVLRVPTRGDAVLKEFKARITARLRSSSSLTLSREFQPERQAGNGDATRSPSDTAFPDVAITDARVTSRQCPTGRQCIDVRWTASAPRQITINGFVVDINVVQGDGSQASVSKTVVGSVRQARLSVEDHSGSSTLSFKVGLTTNFSLSHSRTIVKEGAF